MPISATTTRPPSTWGADLQLVLRWQLERWLGWLHLANGPLCLLLILLVPDISRLLTALLALALTLGAVGQLWLLQQAPHRDRLRRVRRLATAIEWTAGLGVMALCAPFPTKPAPTLLLLLLVFTAGRYGLRGLLAATAGAWLVVLALVTTQAQLLRLWDVEAAWSVGLDWGLLVGLMGLLLAVFLGFAAWWQWQAARLATPDTLPAPTEPPHPPAPVPAAISAGLPSPPLSPRERGVLALLAQEDGPPLRRKEIARQLHISEDTVKTHMRHLAHKLGAEEASRWAILHAARQRGLLDLPPTPPTDDE